MSIASTDISFILGGRVLFLIRLDTIVKQREQSYGPPNDCLLRIGRKWFPNLSYPDDSVAVCDRMLELKLIRLSYGIESEQPFQDSLLDICGYLILKTNITLEYLSLKTEEAWTPHEIIKRVVEDLLITTDEISKPYLKKALKWMLDSQTKYRFLNLNTALSRTLNLTKELLG